MIPNVSDDHILIWHEFKADESKTNAPLRKISNSAQCGRFDLVKACEEVFLLCFLGQIVTCTVINDND